MDENKKRERKKRSAYLCFQFHTERVSCSEVGMGNTNHALTNAENVSIFIFFYSNSVKFEFFFYSRGRLCVACGALIYILTRSRGHTVYRHISCWSYGIPLVTQLRCYRGTGIKGPWVATLLKPPSQISLKESSVYPWKYAMLSVSKDPNAS